MPWDRANLSTIQHYLWLPAVICMDTCGFHFHIHGVLMTLQCFYVPQLNVKSFCWWWFFFSSCRLASAWDDLWHLSRGRRLYRRIKLWGSPRPPHSSAVCPSAEFQGRQTDGVLGELWGIVQPPALCCRAQGLYYSTPIPRAPGHPRAMLSPRQ